MAADTQNHAFPPGIAKAVITVMKALGTLGKEHERNDSGARYAYASIDDFIQHVRDHCAEAGLFIIPNEARDAETQEVTKRDGKSMVVWNARFAFTLVHESGESYGPIYKGVMVPANGAQAAGSAQSYALKQFMRGLFLIPTGDADDPDKSGVEIASKDHPDLIILDVMMPGMDGFAVCEKLRSQVETAFIPIMMLTANPSEEGRIRGYMVGTDDYVSKPFNVAELNARVTRLLRRAYGIS